MRIDKDDNHFHFFRINSSLLNVPARTLEVGPEAEVTVDDPAPMEVESPDDRPTFLAPRPSDIDLGFLPPPKPTQPKQQKVKDATHPTSSETNTRTITESEAMLTSEPTDTTERPVVPARKLSGAFKKQSEPPKKKKDKNKKTNQPDKPVRKPSEPIRKTGRTAAAAGVSDEPSETEQESMDETLSQSDQDSPAPPIHQRPMLVYLINILYE